MNDADEVHAFLTVAAEELQAAKRLADGLPRQAAYALQQTAEKIAKALLVDVGIDPDHTHRIGRLAEALPTAHPLRASLLAMDSLSKYATAMRYPDPAGRLPAPPSQDSLERDILALADLLARARRHVLGDTSAKGDNQR